jgi:hypothetical protein
MVTYSTAVISIMDPFPPASLDVTTVGAGIVAPSQVIRDKFSKKHLIVSLILARNDTPDRVVILGSMVGCQ